MSSLRDFIAITIFSTDISSLRDFLTTTTEINAGIACSDRANEVEPRPNEGLFQKRTPQQSARHCGLAP
ncbi:MAG: hypothetical protein LBG80_15945 [Bacteroidales bacterium]|nr:hypothetical protein [Bacteroidales bacterium]